MFTTLPYEYEHNGHLLNWDWDCKAMNKPLGRHSYINESLIMIIIDSLLLLPNIKLVNVKANNKTSVKKNTSKMGQSSQVMGL